MFCFVNGLVLYFETALCVLSLLDLAIAAGFSVGREFLDTIKSGLGVFYYHILLQFFLSLFIVTKQVRAAPTDSLEHFSDKVQEITVIDWLLKFNMTKVSRTVDLRAHTSSTVAITVHRPHLIVVDAVSDWIPVGVVS
jgi:hypothetical protein